MKYAFALAFATAVIAVLLLAEGSGVISAGELLRDPAATLDYPVRIGALSNLGILLWTAAAVALLFAFAATAGAATPERHVALSLGLFTALLGFDDFFMAHERQFPDKLGVSQYLVLSVYALIALGIGALYRSVFLRAENRILLGFAFGGFALSAAIDVEWLPGSIAFEDGAKLIGIGIYCIWAFDYALRLVRGVHTPDRSGIIE